MPTLVPADTLLSEIASPVVYPQKLDAARSQVLLIRLDEAGYRAASFLDDRVLAGAREGGWVPVARVAEAADSLGDGRPLHFIFHVGHVGSTLLSRLLDETGVVLGLREPLILRQLADAPEPVLISLFARLWGRGFPVTRAVVVKATSSAARIAPELLAARPDARAVYMYLPAEPYLASVLAGENAAQDLNGHGPERTARLAAHLSAPLPKVTSLGELAALSWLAERMTMDAVVRAHGERVMPLDFDALLGHPGETMAAVTQHFGLAVDKAALERIVAGPVMTRYSKAPEHAYSPDFRAQILAQSRAHFGEEIQRGLAWLSKTTS